MSRATSVLCLALLAVASVAGQPSGSQPQLTTPRLEEDQQSALFDSANAPSAPYLLPVNSLSGNNLVDNAAIRQLVADKTAFPILDTLPDQGSAAFITTLKPCGSILPHVHPRATENYLVVAGIMGTGLTEGVGGRQNITGTVFPGQSFIAPQGFMHYNINKQCTPLVFLQIFNSADPGTVNIPGGLAALSQADPESIATANINVTAPALGGPFGLDPTCLKTCGLTSAGGGLSGLGSGLSAFVGLTPSPGQAPATGR